jgi:hypothetical protein
MQIPFLVLSYGDFAKSKKLFSYERDGVHTLPIFTDASRAIKFAESMTQTLRRQFKDKRTLSTQLCNDPKRALQMFETITAYCPDLMRVIIDPHPPVRDDEALTDLENLSWVENFQDIDDVLEQLQDWVSADKEADSITKGEPESNGT